MKKFIALGALSVALLCSTSLQAQESTQTCSPAKTGNPCLSPASSPQINIGAGNPIHLVTGNKFQQENDLYMRPSGLEIVRYYNSNHTAPSAQGAGWRQSYSTRLFQIGQKWQILTDDGRRIMFHAPQASQSPPIAHAIESAYGQLIWTQQETWVWVTPESVVRTFNPAGYLIHQLVPAYLPVTIERLSDKGPQAELITRVSGGDESLLYHYEDLQEQARLVRIDSPVGLFSYHYERPSGYQHHRLSRVIRGDQWQRLYHYEAEHQGVQHTPTAATPTELASPTGDTAIDASPAPANPYLLTGISLSTPEQEALRVNTWAYDAQGRANYSQVGLQGEDALHIDYVQTPASENAQGLTQVKDKAGNLTQIHSVQKAGQYLVEKVSGYGCYLCPAVGTEVSYDSAGRMIRINGHQIKRDESGQVVQIIVPHPSWGPLTIDYDKEHRVTAWHSPVTGKETIEYNQLGQIANRELANGTVYRYTYDKDGGIEYKYTQLPGEKEDKLLNDYFDSYWGYGLSSAFDSYHFKKFNKEYPYYHFTTYARLASKVNFAQTYLITPKSPYEIHYLLPEFGEITRHYYSDRSVKKIDFKPLDNAETSLIQVESNKIQFGNKLVLSQHSLFPNMNLLILKNNKETLWSQLVLQDNSGHVLAETTNLPKLSQTQKINYLYDSKLRMVVAKNKENNNFQNYFYAWNQDGSSLAYKNKNQTIIPKIVRDASGLPTKVNDIELIYNTHKRIQHIKKNGSEIVSYQYDSSGRRIAKKFKNKWVIYFYLGNKLVGEWETNNEKEAIYAEERVPLTFNANIHRRYIYAGDLPVAFIDYPIGSTENKSGPYHTRKPITKNQHTLYYIHTNHIGQPIMVTDEQQNIRWLAQYSPTGEAKILKADIDFNLRSPGQYYDAETGWHDNYYRTYDPQAGHYLEPDPIGPLNINDPYGYAAQQPRRYIDPEGLLLFAFDGTTNNPSSNTNVLKMFKLYDGTKYYVEGPGANPDEGFIESTTAALFNSTAPKIFETHKKNLLSEVKRIGLAHYDNTIPIDIIGFSRGAAIGMTFANFIQENTDMGYFNYSWFEEDPKTQIPTQKAVSACIDLRFIGLFDTVAQYGLIGSRNFTVDYSATEDWGVIAHAVALNEHRDLLPLVTYQENDYVVEQPFIGNHSDLGGVHVEKDKTDPDNPHPNKLYGDLSHIPLAWIYTQAQTIGVPLKELSTVKTVDGSELHKIKNPVMHSSYGKFEVPWFNDRGLERPNTPWTFTKQDKNQKLGKTVREQHALEADLRHFSEYTPTWHPGQVGIYGLIDAKEYLNWLENTIGWTAPLEVIPFTPTQ